MNIQSIGPYHDFCGALDAYKDKLVEKVRKFQKIEREEGAGLSKAIYEIYKSYMIPLVRHLSAKSLKSEVNHPTSLTPEILSKTIESLEKVCNWKKQVVAKASVEWLETSCQKIALLEEEFLSSKVSSVVTSDREFVERNAAELSEKLETLADLGAYGEMDLEQGYSDIAGVLRGLRGLDRSRKIAEFIKEFNEKLESLASQMEDEEVSDLSDKGFVKKCSEDLFGRLEQVHILEEFTEGEKKREWSCIRQGIDKYAGAKREEVISEMIASVEQRIFVAENSDSEMEDSF